MSSQPKSYLTPEQYLEIERKADFKSEYYNGEMFAMSGARVAHVRIVTHAIRELAQQLRNQTCEPFSSEMRVQVANTGLYTYPDIVVVCGEPEFRDDSFDTLLNPTVIVEVLSESTQLYDREQKFELYRSIESLKEYLMISSLRVSAELYTRQSSGGWLFTSQTNLQDSIDLESIGCHLLLADLYEKVAFSPSSPLLPR
jgi:Uma2 family endonuclease